MSQPLDKGEGGRWSLDLVGDVKEGFVDAHLLELIGEATYYPHYLRREAVVVVEVWPHVDVSRAQGPGTRYRPSLPDPVISRHVVAGDHDSAPLPSSGVGADDYRFVRQGGISLDLRRGVEESMSTCRMNLLSGDSSRRVGLDKPLQRKG